MMESVFELNASKELKEKSKASSDINGANVESAMSKIVSNVEKKEKKGFPSFFGFFSKKKEESKVNSKEETEQKEVEVEGEKKEEGKKEKGIVSEGNYQTLKSFGFLSLFSFFLLMKSK